MGDGGRRIKQDAAGRQQTEINIIGAARAEDCYLESEREGYRDRGSRCGLPARLPACLVLAEMLTASDGPAATSNRSLPIAIARRCRCSNVPLTASASHQGDRARMEMV